MGYTWLLWHISCRKNKEMKSKGLGDSIHNFTSKTGIKSVVDRVSNGLNIPCGCEGRREALNIMFPYKNK